MKMKLLSRLAKQIWGSELCTHGFAERNGRYLRIINSGVVHLLTLAKDPHGGATFMVMCGVDATCFGVDEDKYGFIKHQNFCHLTRKGWDSSSGRWPCETEEEAQESLIALRQLVLDLALPWLDAHTTLSSVGDEISEIGSPGMGWMKARLYMLDGDIPRAREAIERYAAWAAKPRNWGTKEHQREDMARAEQVRQEIEAAVSGKGD